MVGWAVMGVGGCEVVVVGAGGGEGGEVGGGRGEEVGGGKIALLG